MKVGELRAKLAKLKKEEISYLAVEFYKLVPKAKKEDYDLDNLINNPTKPKKKTSKSTQLSLAQIKSDVYLFIENAKEQNYLFPNRKVPKKERSTWRFKVKRWYKELNNLKRKDADIQMQADILSDLYELICESCGYEYFTAYDSFESIGIEQSDFYKSVLTLKQEAYGKSATIEKGVRLIVDNYLNRYTLYSTLIVEFMSTLNIPDLKEKAITACKKLIQENNFVPKETKSTRFFFDNNEYQQKYKHNELTKFVLRLYISLYETEEGIEFYKAHYQDRDEVKLYILIDILFDNKEEDLIVKEISEAEKNGIEPREKLLKLRTHINNTGKLPEYMH